MLILCCDTATDHGVFALADENGSLLGAIVEEHRRTLSTRFFGCVDRLLAMAGVDFEAVDALAVGLGPGSFTGVRIAVTTLRTLAQVSGKPLIGICTLDLFAHAGMGSSAAGIIAALLPSRRNEVYVGLYNKDDIQSSSTPDAGGARSGTETVNAPTRDANPSRFGVERIFAATHAEAIERIRDYAAGRVVVAIGPDAARPEGFDLLPFRGGREGFTGGWEVREAPSPEAFARLAAAAARRGDFGDPLALNPLYVVPPAINQHLDRKATARLSSR